MSQSRWAVFVVYHLDLVSRDRAFLAGREVGPVIVTDTASATVGAAPLRPSHRCRLSAHRLPAE